MGSSLLASLLHDVLLSRRGRVALRTGLAALKAQEEQMAPPDQLRFPRELLQGLKRWTFMPGLGVRGCVVAHEQLTSDRAVPASRIFHRNKIDLETGMPALAEPRIRISVTLFSTLGKSADQPVRLILSTKTVVRVRRHDFFYDGSPTAGVRQLPPGL